VKIGYVKLARSCLIPHPLFNFTKGSILTRANIYDTRFRAGVYLGTQSNGQITLAMPNGKYLQIWPHQAQAFSKFAHFNPLLESQGIFQSISNFVKKASANGWYKEFSNSDSVLVC